MMTRHCRAISLAPALALLASCATARSSVGAASQSSYTGGGFRGATPLSSPLDCIDHEEFEDVGSCGGDSPGEPTDLIACAYGSALYATSSTTAFVVSPAWLTARGPLQAGARCSGQSTLGAIGEGHDHTKSSRRLPVALPLVASKWLTLASAIRDSGADGGGKSVSFRSLGVQHTNDGESYRGRASRTRAGWSSGGVACEASFRAFADKARANDDVAESGAQMESGVRREFAFRVTRENDRVVLHLRAATSVENGLNEGELLDTSLKCIARNVSELVTPPGFDFEFRPVNDGREWTVSVFRNGANAQ